MRLREDRGEYTPATWIAGAVSAVTLGSVVLLLERWVGAQPVYIVFMCGCAVAILCLYGAQRQLHIDTGRKRAESERPPLVSPPNTIAAPATTFEPPTAIATQTPLLPPPSVIAFVTCEAPVMLIQHRTGGAYRRLPAEGDIAYGAVAAFRHRSGGNAVLTAHVRYLSGENIVHAHSAAWVGSSDSSYTLGPSKTVELILAVRRAGGIHYAIDVGSSGMTHKPLKDGPCVAEVEIEIWRGETVCHVFDLVLAATGLAAVLRDVDPVNRA